MNGPATGIAPKFLIKICTVAEAILSFAKCCLAVLGVKIESTFRSLLNAINVQGPLFGITFTDIERLPDTVLFFAATPSQVVVLLFNPSIKKEVTLVLPITFMLSPFNCNIS